MESHPPESRPIQHWLRRFELHSLAKWIFLASVIGVIAGLGAIVFDILGQLVTRFTLAEFAGYVPPDAEGEHARFDHQADFFWPWMIVAVMTVGGLVSGILVFTFAPETGGAGTDAAIGAFHNDRGKIRARVPFIKTLASAITLGTGGSGGREGPIGQIGAGFGSWLATRLGLSARERRIMLAVGMGAGVGAIFRAPLAGAVFAGEILYSEADLEADVIVPAASASVIAYSVYVQTLPIESRFVPLFGGGLEHTFSSPIQLPAYAFLAVLLVLMGAIYVKSLLGVQSLFERIPILPHVKPAIGAAIAGLIGVSLYFILGQNEDVLGSLGTGYGALQLALTDAREIGVGFLLAIAFAKILTTSFTIGPGGAGGVFGPSMVIGGSTGAAIGLTLQHLWPEVFLEPEAFAVVGMAGFFSGIARAPISTIIMVRALTGDYGLLLPTMLVSTLTFVLSQHFRLYQKQPPTRMESRAHRGDFIIDVLEGLRVSDLFQQKQRVILIHEGLSLDEIVHRLAYTHQHYFPVVDNEERMVGIFSDDDVRAYLYDDTLWSLAVARDIMVDDFVSLVPNDDLNTTLKRLISHNLDALPVLDPERPGTFLGMLSRKEIVAAYNQRLIEHKQSVED